MDSLKTQLFYIPIIALTLIIVGYFYFLKKTNEKESFKALFRNIALFAFVLNFIWEVAHGFLYEGYIYDLNHIAFGALATVADVFMVLLLYFGCSLFLGNVFWIRQLNYAKAFLVMVIGGVGAIFGEIKHLAAGNWAYSDSMPLLPMADVGVTPVLQFMILPVLIYWISSKAQQTTSDLKPTGQTN